MKGETTIDFKIEKSSATENAYKIIYCEIKQQSAIQNRPTILTICWEREQQSTKYSKFLWPSCTNKPKAVDCKAIQQNKHRPAIAWKRITELEQQSPVDRQSTEESRPSQTPQLALKWYQREVDSPAWPFYGRACVSVRVILRDDLRQHLTPAGARSYRTLDPARGSAPLLWRAWLGFIHAASSNIKTPQFLKGEQSHRYQCWLLASWSMRPQHERKRWRLSAIYSERGKTMSLKAHSSRLSIDRVIV